MANAQVLLNSAVTEEGVWSLSPFLPTPLFLCHTVGSYRSPRPLRPGPAPALIPERHLVVPGVPSYQEGKPCLGRLSHSPKVTREPGGTAGTEMQPAVYPRGIPAQPKDPPMQLRQDLPVNQGKTGGDHTPAERGEGTAMRRERGELSWRRRCFCFASLAHSFHRGSDPVAPASSGGSLTLRVETQGPRLDLKIVFAIISNLLLQR